MRQRLCEVTGAAEVTRIETIQPLWNNYGTLSRVTLAGSGHRSVVVKHIMTPSEVSHPRGFTSYLSHERKLRSYQVEARWYQEHNIRVPSTAPTPRCLDVFKEGEELLLVLEDLTSLGFTTVLSSASMNEITLVLRWLAAFHASFLGDEGDGLWPIGTYWHLDTRPEELENISGTRLHRFASLIDGRLRHARYKTLVHGDAKLANFCFTDARDRVAGVDFQYVGQGCAMKDVAYFLGSCLSGAQCEGMESELLDIYFTALRSCLSHDIDAGAVENEWRRLYPLAWADFERFMQGWSPGHRKLTEYSDATTERALDQIQEELLSAARSASLSAGRYIKSMAGQSHPVGSKGFENRASDVVTAVDLQAQEIILQHLEPTITRYGFGLLAEEGEQDETRLTRHAFWTIDPLDGTQHFIERATGYATSIALVKRDGTALLGMVYDPVHDTLYEAVAGEGVLVNGESMRRMPPPMYSAKVTWFADLSLRRHPAFARYADLFHICFEGGAVMNTIHLLTTPNSVYLKPPRGVAGGCAIWDLAAVSLMLTELGGHALDYTMKPLHLNQDETVFFHKTGLILASRGVNLAGLLPALEEDQVTDQ